MFFGIFERLKTLFKIVIFLQPLILRIDNACVRQRLSGWCSSAATFVAKKERMPSAPSARRPDIAGGAGADRGHWLGLAKCSCLQTRARPASHANAARVQAGQKNSCSAATRLRFGSSSRRCFRGDRRVLRRCRHRVCRARRQRATRWTRPPWSAQRLKGVWWAFGKRLAARQGPHDRAGSGHGASRPIGGDHRPMSIHRQPPWSEFIRILSQSQPPLDARLRHWVSQSLGDTILLPAAL